MSWWPKPVPFVAGGVGNIDATTPISGASDASKRKTPWPQFHVRKFDVWFHLSF
jgi:hypothetical protein